MRLFIKNILILFFCRLLSNFSYSQIDNWQNPPSTDWKVVETERFQIIFPSLLEKDALRTLNTLEHIYKPASKTLAEPDKISLILQNQLSISNGFVSAIPRRMEFFNTPPQSFLTGSSDWYNLLSIHELRHVIQIDKINKRFNGFISLIFGAGFEQQLEAFSIPSWYMEGDATLTETLLTNGGRGRLPEFDAELRALLLANKRYSYDKAVFGSYKDWDPLESPYLLGYYLNTHIRRNNDAAALSNTLHRTSLLPFIPFMFSLGLNAEIDKGIFTNYEETIDEIDSLFKNQVCDLKCTPERILQNVDQSTWTYNYAPQSLPDGNIFVYRMGLDDLPKFIKIDLNTKIETEIITPGRINYNTPVIKKNRIVWSEDFFDPRWGYRSYSDIKTYDQETNRTERITHDKRYFAPTLSNDAGKIAAVEFSSENICSIVILNSANGEIIRKIPNTENEFISTPSFSPDDKKIVYCKTSTKNTKSLCLYDFQSGQEEIIAPNSGSSISTPITDNQYIYYVSSYSGIDNIYALNISTKQIFQVTSVKVGAYNPALSPDNKKLLFNTVNEFGYIAADMDLNLSEWLPLEKVQDRSINYFSPLISQEYGKSVFDSIPEKKYEVKDYNHTANLINFHSWLPWVDPDQKNASITLTSANILNTLYSNIGYEYNWEKKAHTVFLGTQYAGLYPIIDIGLQYGNRAAKYNLKNGNSDFYTWREKSINLGANIPLNLTTDRNSTYLSFGINSEYIFLSNISDAEYFKNLGSFSSLSYQVSFFRGYGWIKDLKPIFGQSINLFYSHSPFNSDYKTEFLSASGNLYFPGLYRYHSIALNTGYEHQTYDGYKYSSMISFARGYNSYFFEDIYKAGLNYAFPLWYPDLNILHLAYLKRFSLNSFYDYLLGSMKNKNYLYRSFGVELSIETGFLSNSNIMVDLVFRYSYLIEKRNTNFEFFIRIN